MKKENIGVYLIVIFIVLLLFLNLYLFFKENKVIVLAYHKFVPLEVKNESFKNDDWIDSTDRFEKQIKYLYNHKYKSLSMNEYESWRNGKLKLPRKSVLITIDDGDLSTYYEVLPILEKYNLKATTFIIGESIKPISEKYNPKKNNF